MPAAVSSRPVSFPAIFAETRAGSHFVSRDDGISGRNRGSSATISGNGSGIFPGYRDHEVLHRTGPAKERVCLTWRALHAPYHVNWDDIEKSVTLEQTAFQDLFFVIYDSYIPMEPQSNAEDRINDKTDFFTISLFGEI